MSKQNAFTRCTEGSSTPKTLAEEALKKLRALRQTTGLSSEELEAYETKTRHGIRTLGIQEALNV